MDISKIEHYFKLILEEGLGLDTKDPNLLETPKRVAKMYQDFFSGVGSDFENVTSFPNEQKYNDMVIIDGMFFVSMCSHHFLPFYGQASLIYIPKNKLMGASKAARVIAHYAARPQLQEKLGQEVAECLIEKLNPKGLMLIMSAAHGCMRCRGIKQNSSRMITSSIHGSMKDQATRNEALMLLSLQSGIKI